MTKRDEAGAQIAMEMQFGEALAANGPAGVTQCLSMDAEHVGWTVVGKDMLSWTFCLKVSNSPVRLPRRGGVPLFHGTQPGL